MSIDPIAFSIFGLEIRWYGIITALSLVIGFTVAYFIARYRGKREEEILNFAPFAVISSILFARLSIPTSPNTFFLAVVTYTLPGPAILSTFLMLSVPYVRTA
ncbi:unnamed protein product, partial [marine sediment metagenome]